VIIQNLQALQALQANLMSMSDEDLRKIQIHIEGRLVFPNLETARAPKSNPAGRKTYGAVLVFPMNQVPQVTQVGMTAIVSITSRLKQMYHPNVPDRNYIKSYKNIQENPVQDNGNPHPDFYQGNWWVNTSSGEKHKPKIFKKINNQITEVLPNDPDVYFGQNVIFVVTLYPTGIDPKKPEIRKGVSANLIGILILGGGEKLASNSQQVEIDPNASFSAFSSMTADFSSGSTNPFGGGNQTQPGNSFVSSSQNQQYTPPANNQFMGNGAANGGTNQFGQTNHGNQTGGFQQGGPGQTAQTNASPSSNPFGGGNFGGGQNNNNGSNPFGGGLI